MIKEDRLKEEIALELVRFSRLMLTTNSVELGSLLARVTLLRSDLAKLGSILLRESHDRETCLDTIVYLKDIRSVYEKRNRILDAQAVSVWIYTLKAIVNPQLYFYGWQIWKELTRGFDHVPVVLELMKYEGRSIPDDAFTLCYCIPEPFQHAHERRSA